MKKLFIGVCLLVILGLMAACGGGADDTADTGVDTENQAQIGQAQDEHEDMPGDIDWSEHVTFTWFMTGTPPNDFYTSYNDNPVVKYLENRFNVTFDFHQAVTGTEADALALMMGSGNYTDAINLAVYLGNIPQLYEDGVIIDIAQWLDYMPNFRHLLETNPDFARAAFDDEGRIFQLIMMGDEAGYSFSGLLYRHDILYTMTGGNVQFPSGNEGPVTIEDWEYMLPLFQQYFQAAGFADYAAFILPPNGVIHFGALMNSFGAYHQMFVRDGVVYAGIMEPEFFDYITTMRDWFANGWIHQDFASRVGDMFFMPNPPLVFGGAAGSFYGMIMHAGDRLSMPEFGLEFDVRAMPSPKGPGITHEDMLRRREDPFGLGRHSAVTTSNPDIGRFLAIIDTLYTEYGGRLRALGVNAEQIAPNDTVMARMGMPDGSWWFDAAGNIMLHESLDIMGGENNLSATNGIRLPGLYAQSVLNNLRDEEAVYIHAAWTAQCAVSRVHPLPEQLTPTIAEAAILAANEPHIDDFRDQMLMMFIMGTQELNEQTWTDFLNQLRAFGIEENRAIYQAAFDRFMARGQ